MSRVRQETYSPLPISEVWNGSHSTGFVAGTGGFARIEDVSHPRYREHLGSGDVGGPMILHRSRVGSDFGRCFSGPGNGSKISLRVSWDSSDAPEPHGSDLWGLGATAIARTTPTNPSWAGLDAMAQYVGRDAIPKAMGSSVWKAQALRAKEVGKEYLNLAFGWAPLVSDILSVCRAVKTSHQYMEELKAGSDRMTRVGYHFPEQTSSGPLSLNRSLYSVNPGITGWDIGGTVTSSVESSTTTWFSGAFRYHIPGIQEALDKSSKFVQYADHVLGIRLSPEVLWDAAPWSWAVDWALNVGDVARNIGNFHQDGLLLQYGYIMSHTVRKQQFVFTGGTRTTGTSTTRLQEWKVRFPASPYGFGLTYEGLTPSQKAILAAVGISHF